MHLQSYKILSVLHFSVTFHLDCFVVYDLNGDGFISREEMFQLLKNSLVKQPTEEDPDEGVKELVELSLKKMVCILTGPDMETFFNLNLWLFSYPSFEICVVAAQKNRLIEMVLLSTNNIYFGWEIKDNN